MPATTLEFTYDTPVLAGGDVCLSAMVEIPIDMLTEFKAQKVKRFVGTIAAQPFRLSIQHSKKTDFYYLFLGNAFRKKAGIRIGEMVTISIKPDPNPTEIVMPEEWQEYLEQDEEAKTVWDTLTPGLQRSLTYYISTAKHIDTRINRSIALGEKLKKKDLYYFQNK